MPAKKYPIWFLPNLWSLDAPMVAMAWMFMLGCSWRQQHLQASTYFVLAASVWCVYVMDRLIDAFLSKRTDVELKRRHYYHERYRWAFLTVFVIVLVYLAYLLLYQMPREIFIVGIPAAAVSVCYFIVAASRKNDDAPIVKNSLAGVAFAFGVAAATCVYLPVGGLVDLFTSSEVLFFAVLCILNINAIDIWEFARKEGDVERKEAAEISLTLPLTLLAGTGILMAWWADEYARPFYYAIVFSAAALQIINRMRSRFSMMELRVLADIALLLPVPLFFLV